MKSHWRRAALVSFLLASAPPVSTQGVAWSQVYPQLPARMDHAASYDQVRNRTVVFGGRGEYGLLGDTWEYANGQWIQRHPDRSPPAQENHDMAWHARAKRVFLLGKKQLWSWDGDDWTLHGPAPSDGTLLYDSDKSRLVIVNGGVWDWDGFAWEQIATTGPKIEAGQAVYDKQRRLIVAMAQRSTMFDMDIWEWDGKSWQVHQPVLSANARNHCKVIYRGNGITEIGPGVNEYNCNNEQYSVTWDGKVTQRATKYPWFPWYRDYAWAENGHMVLGAFGFMNPLSQCWRYLASPNADMHLRVQFALGYDRSRKSVVVTGGYTTTNSAVNETWEWNGNQWSKTAAGPTQASGCMAWDDTNQELVLFTGSTAQTWIRKGTTWQPSNPSQNPGYQLDHTMAHDPVSGQVLLYGNSNTWCWDGAKGTWTKLSTTGPKGSYPQMTTDTVRKVVFMAAGGYLYEWHKGAWVQRIKIPSVDSIAFDESRQLIVLFGDGVWEYDGSSALRQRHPLNGPKRLGRAKVWYDPQRKAILAFRGEADIIQYGISDPTLTADRLTIGLTAGGTQNLIIDASQSFSGKYFLLLGSMSGTRPGVPLNPSFTLPLNLDFYTIFTLTNPNGLLHANSRGILDARGQATPSIHIPPAAYASMIGTRMHHASLIFDAGGFRKVTNAVSLELTK